MKIFDFDDYKAFMIAKIDSMPRKGRGQKMRIAELLGVHTTMVTHVLGGDANLSVEQALKLARSWALTELETDYFVLLVTIERAGNVESKNYYGKQLKALKNRALKLSERLNERKGLSDSEQALFYSSWHYSGIRLLTATGQYRSAEQIAEKLDLPTKLVAEILNFLMETKLLKNGDGRFEVGEQRTYVDNDSKWVGRHHLNWRLKAIELLPVIPPDELVFTNAITVSERDFAVILEEISQMIERFRRIADPSPPERLCFLNIDWRKVRIKY